MNLIHTPIGSVFPSKTNPRKDFSQEYIDQLASSMREHGVFQPLQVRTMPDGPDHVSPGTYKLISGECRLRAAKLAGLEKIPVIVRDDLSDDGVLELQLIENLQRKDLSVIEEADGFAFLLSLRDGEDPRWTIQSLAERVGKSTEYVRERIWLRRLSPEGREAVRSGQLSFAAARVVARIPSEKHREKALEEILKPTYEDEPLSARKAQAHVRAHYMVDLKGVPWKLGDAQLVPARTNDAGERCFGGACEDCPFLSGNDPAAFADILIGSRASSVCTHPECYQAKVDASWEEERMAALKAGKKVLDNAAAEKIFDRSGHVLRWDAPYVALNDLVPEKDLRGEFKKQPTWKKLIAGSPSAPEIVVVRDARGRAVELVDRKQAVAASKLAAKAAGEDSPLVSSASGKDPSLAADRKRFLERKKVCKKIAFDAMDALREAINQKGIVDGFWALLVDIGYGVAGSDGLSMMCKWLGVEPSDADSKSFAQEDALRKGFKGTPDADLVAIFVLLQLSRGLRWAASPSEHSGASSHEGTTEAFEAFAALYGIDTAEIRKKAKAALAPEKPKKSVEAAAAEFKKQADEGVRAARKGSK